MVARLALLLVCLTAPALAQAPPGQAAAPRRDAAPQDQPAAKAGGGPPQDWRLRLSLYGRAKLPADLDDRGREASVGVYRAGASASAGRFFGFIQLGFGVSGERSDYDFSKSERLNAPPDLPTPGDPWDVLSFVRLRVNALIPFGRSRWSLFLFGSVRFGWENGTELDRGISATAFAAVGYRFDETLTLQAGIIFISRIEDSPIAFPVVGVRWRPTDWFRLESRGPGLELGVRPAPWVELTLGARYDNRQFRLEDRRVVLAGHIVEDQEVVVELGASFTVLELLTVRGVAGLVAYQEFEVRAEDGDVRYRARTDPAPFFELRVTLNF